MSLDDAELAALITLLKDTTATDLFPQSPRIKSLKATAR